MPARIEKSRAVNANSRGPLFQFLDLCETLVQIVLVTKNADVILHRFLQVAMHVVRTVGIFALKRLQHFPRSSVSLRAVNVRRADSLRMFGCRLTGPSTEYQQI